LIMCVTKTECGNDVSAKNGVRATDVIRRYRKIDWIRVRHEEVATFVAGGEAHRTNELAVCAGSGGRHRGQDRARDAALRHAGKGFTLHVIKAVISERGDEVVDIAKTSLRL
jgi:hypothetical protein